MAEYLDVWQCIGCGRVEEVPQTCIGVCRTVKRKLVDQKDYDAIAMRLERYAEVLRLIAGSTPRRDACLEHWRALQGRARAVLTEDSGTSAARASAG